MIAVAFTVSGGREEYLRRTLESWHKVRGVSSVRLLFCVEPHPKFPVRQFGEWLDRSFPAQATVHVNERQLECLGNTRQAFAMGFSLGADFVVMAEEDITVASDVLEYLSWCEEKFRDCQDVAMVCSHTKESDGSPDQVFRAPWFNPLVTGTWKDRWEKFVLPNWGGMPPNERGITAYQAWDINLRLKIREAGMVSVFPAVSRALHIGEYSTWLTPMLSSAIYRDSTSYCYRDDIPPQEYREVGFNDIPRVVV